MHRRRGPHFFADKSKANRGGRNVASKQLFFEGGVVVSALTGLWSKGTTTDCHACFSTWNCASGEFLFKNWSRNTWEFKIEAFFHEFKLRQLKFWIFKIFSKKNFEVHFRRFGSKMATKVGNVRIENTRSAIKLQSWSPLRRWSALGNKSAAARPRPAYSLASKIYQSRKLITRFFVIHKVQTRLVYFIYSNIHKQLTRHL